jgi:hypothetical protein
MQAAPVGIGRIAAAQLVDEIDPVGFDVGEGDLLAGGVLPDELDGAPVGEVRHGQRGERGERRLDVEGRRQELAHVGEEPDAIHRASFRLGQLLHLHHRQHQVLVRLAHLGQQPFAIELGGLAFLVRAQHGLSQAGQLLAFGDGGFARRGARLALVEARLALGRGPVAIPGHDVSAPLPRGAGPA